MIEYDPGKPLISIHIPKCAGTSFRSVLKSWFGDRLHFHYFQQLNAPPPRLQPGPGSCIHGHFNNAKGFGAYDYYPGIDQFITFLRDPVDVAVSNYFFWKTKGRARQLRDGRLTEEYADIRDFFRKRPRSQILSFLPRPVDWSNYREMLDRYFVWIVIVEDLPASLDALARRLGFPSASMDRVNVSARDEELPDEARDRFAADNALEIAIYEYARAAFRAAP